MIKFLIRQTFDVKTNNSSTITKLKDSSFYKFLFEAGMFRENKFFEYMNESEKLEAKERYLKALSMSVQGSDTV